MASGKGFIHFRHSAYTIASAYAIMGQPIPALRCLRETAETGWPCYPYFAADPNLANIRTDPGVAAFLRELKAQWERYQSLDRARPHHPRRIYLSSTVMAAPKPGRRGKPLSK